MRLLLDTHIAFWLGFEPERLTIGERAVLAAERRAFAMSVVSLWELRVKWDRRFASGRRIGPIDPAILLSTLRQASVQVLDLSPETCIAELDPPLSHSDPFDQLLLAHAQQEGCRLLTRDDKLKVHPVALVVS